MLFWIDINVKFFQIDGRTKWWNRSAQERKKETMKERIKTKKDLKEWIAYYR